MDESVKRILDLLPQFVGSTDPAMRCRYANRAYAEFLGRSPESMIGVSVRELWGQMIFEEVEPFLDRALAGEIVSFSKRIRHINGEKRFGKVDLIPEPQGGYTVLIHDLDSVERHMKDRERLIHELDHRVNNILQILESVLALESQSADSRTATVLDSIKARVDALALSYELLKDGEPTGGWLASAVLEKVVYSVGPGVSASFLLRARSQNSRPSASRHSSSSRRRSRVGRSRTAESPVLRRGAFRRAWSLPSRTLPTST